MPLTRFCLNQNKRRLATHSAALLAACFAVCLVPRFCSPSGTASIPFSHRFLARPASPSCLFGTLSCSPFGAPFCSPFSTPFCSPFGKPYCSPLGTLFSILFGASLLQPVWQVVLQPAARLAPFQQSVLGTYLAGPSLASDLLHLSLPVCLWRIIKRREAGRRSKGRVAGGCIPWRAQPGFHCKQEWPIPARFDTCRANHLTP